MPRHEKRSLPRVLDQELRIVAFAGAFVPIVAGIEVL